MITFKIQPHELEDLCSKLRYPESSLRENYPQVTITFIKEFGMLVTLTPEQVVHLALNGCGDWIEEHKI